MFPMIIAAGAVVAAGAVSSFLSSRGARKAAEKRRQRAIEAASVQRLMAILSQIHPVLRSQIAATFGPAVTQALDRQASLLGPSGAGAATASAAVLAPEVAAFSAALPTALDLQRLGVQAELGSPGDPSGSASDFAAALAGGARGFLGFSQARKAAIEATIARDARRPLNPMPIEPPDFTPRPGDEPELLPSPLLPPTRGPFGQF